MAADEAEQSNALDQADPSGEVDVSLIDRNLRLSYAERAERHYRARLFVQRLRRLSRERYGSAVDDSEAASRSKG